MRREDQVQTWTLDASGNLWLRNYKEIGICKLPTNALSAIWARRRGFSYTCDTVLDMLVGTGIDLIEIERIAASIQRFGPRFLERIYTPAEIAYCSARKGSAESFAARFAAKEAGAKALGTGISRGVSWLEIEVLRQPGRRPVLVFHGRAKEIAQRLGARHISLSITHSRELAMASVALED